MNIIDIVAACTVPGLNYINDRIFDTANFVLSRPVLYIPLFAFYAWFFFFIFINKIRGGFDDEN